MKNKNLIWIILLLLSCVPFILSLAVSIYSIFFGFTFIFNTTYGLDAFADSISVLLYLLWPLYIVYAILIAFSVFMLVRGRRRTK